MKMLPPFLTTYLCEFGFSTFLLLKNKLRNKLDVKSDLRLALAQSIAPRFDMILIKTITPTSEQLNNIKNYWYSGTNKYD